METNVATNFVVVALTILNLGNSPPDDDTKSHVFSRDLVVGGMFM